MPQRAAPALRCRAARRRLIGAARALLSRTYGGPPGLSRSRSSWESSMLRFIGFAVLILLVIGLLVVFGVLDLIF